MPVNQTEEFEALVAFHGCYCLDIALGYRVAKALMREMGEDMRNLKHVVAYVGAPTCAIDAIQKIASCTLGKRNLHYTNSGKSTFVLHNTVTGKAVRAYCHYWDTFDHDAWSHFRKEASDPITGTQEKKQALRFKMEEGVSNILSSPEADLFRISRVDLPVPPASSKYRSAPCAVCGEYAKHDLLVERGEVKLCAECVARAGKNDDDVSGF